MPRRVPFAYASGQCVLANVGLVGVWLIFRPVAAGTAIDVSAEKCA